jgi:hypothetical protein
MKVVWNLNGRPDTRPSHTSSTIKRFTVNSIRIGSRRGEFYLVLGDTIVILPPTAAVLLAKELRLQLESYQSEAKMGRMAPSSPGREESVPKAVLRSLYKSHKVSKHLITINTKRRSHLRSGKSELEKE